MTLLAQGVYDDILLVNITHIHKASTCHYRSQRKTSQSRLHIHHVCSSSCSTNGGVVRCTNKTRKGGLRDLRRTRTCSYHLFATHACWQPGDLVLAALGATKSTTSLLAWLDGLRNTGQFCGYLRVHAGSLFSSPLLCAR
jgi:hypothetical protein